MQLPPTILSLDNNKKKKQGPAQTKSSGKKTAPPKATLDFKDKSKTDVPEPPLVQSSQDKDHNTNSADESDEEGDAIMKDDEDVHPSNDETKAETPAPGNINPPIVKSFRRGVLIPPRTLETTLFDRLEKMYGPGIKRLLNVQYR